jgi:hypothetical protein
MTLSTVAAFLPALASARRVAGPVRMATGLVPAITRANGTMCPGSCTTGSAATAATSNPRTLATDGTEAGAVVPRSGVRYSRDRNSAGPDAPNSDLVTLVTLASAAWGVARRDTIRRDTADAVGSVAATARAAKWRARGTAVSIGNDDAGNDDAGNDDAGNDDAGNDEPESEGDAPRVLAIGATLRSAKGVRAGGAV